MLQPFERLQEKYLQRLLQLQRFYMIAQTYERAAAECQPGSTALLFSDYEVEGLALIHYNAVRHDAYAAMLDLRKPLHYNKLTAMCTPGARFEAFWAVVKSTADLEKKINLGYKDQMRTYIKMHTTWRIGGSETIKPSIAVIFGELFITLKYAGQTLKVKFSDIEKV